MRRSGSIAVALLCVLAACSSGDKSKSADTGNTPVLFGMISMEAAGRPTLVNLRRGTDAAIRYFNAERGGLHGHRIELRNCATTGAPETSANCAHDMVSQHVIAVRGGADVGSPASLPILTAAGIPYLGPIPLLPADLTTPGVFTFSPGGMANAASAAYAADSLKAKKVAILEGDDAAGKNLAEAFVKPALVHGGVAPSNITIHSDKLDSAQLGSIVAAAAADKPDAIMVLFPGPACARIMQAAAQLQVKAPMFYVEACGSPEVLHQVGAAADGVYFSGAFLNAEANKADPDMKLYKSKVAKYGDGVDPSSAETLIGFATTMTVLSRLATVAGDLTSAAVTAAFKTAVDAPGFLSHAYTCDAKQAIPAFVSVCNAQVRLYQFKGGHYRDVLGRWVSAAAPLAR